jgi:uncharacterized damage-inducible protein DinB
METSLRDEGTIIPEGRLWTKRPPSRESDGGRERSWADRRDLHEGDESMRLESYVNGLANAKKFFDRSTSCFEEADSGFAPKPEMFTVAQHVAHAAQTVDWFMEGAFGGKGFETDFARLEADVRKISSLKQARAWMDRAIENAVKIVGSKSEADLQKSLPPGIMGGMPVGSIVPGIAEHTGHHRGALTVYARLLGKTPPMPYS